MKKPFSHNKIYNTKRFKRKKKKKNYLPSINLQKQPPEAVYEKRWS